MQRERYRRTAEEERKLKNLIRERFAEEERKLKNVCVTVTDICRIYYLCMISVLCNDTYVHTSEQVAGRV